MVHTFLVRYRLTRTEYDIFEKKLQGFVMKRKEEGKTIYTFPTKNLGSNVHGYTYCLTSGLTIRTMRRYGDFPFLWMEMEVNLATLLFGKNPYKITEGEDVQKATAIVDEQLKKVELILCLKDCYMSRSDFASNIKLDSRKQVERYMQLLKKYNNINHYKEEPEYSSRGHRKKTFDNSVYLMSGSRTVNIYIKRDQVEDMKEKSPTYFENLDFEEEDIIRFEIQNKKRGINTIANINSFESKSPSLFLSEELSYGELAKYIKKLYGTGDYYTYHETYNKVMNTRFDADMKRDMMGFMKRAARIPVHAVKEEYFEKGYTVIELRNILNNFDKLNINPVPIPKSWGYSRIPGPYTYITSRNSVIAWE